jgi:hypothetical protein
MKKQIEVWVEIISLLFIVLFGYAASSKLLTYEKFEVQIGQSPLLTGLGEFLPVCVLSVEFLVVVFLMIERLRLVGLIMSFSLMVMFTAYIGAILTFSPYLPCSCGGVLELLGWRAHFIFNLVFVGLSVIGIWLQAHRLRVAKVPDGEKQADVVEVIHDSSIR